MSEKSFKSRGRAHQCKKCDWTGEKAWAVEHFVKHHCTMDDAPHGCRTCVYKCGTDSGLGKHLKNKEHKRKIRSRTEEIFRTSKTIDLELNFRKLSSEESTKVWNDRHKTDHQTNAAKSDEKKDKSTSQTKETKKKTSETKAVERKEGADKEKPKNKSDEIKEKTSEKKADEKKERADKEKPKTKNEETKEKAVGKIEQTSTKKGDEARDETHKKSDGKGPLKRDGKIPETEKKTPETDKKIPETVKKTPETVRKISETIRKTPERQKKAAPSLSSKSSRSSHRGSSSDRKSTSSSNSSSSKSSEGSVNSKSSAKTKSSATSAASKKTGSIASSKAASKGKETTKKRIRVSSSSRSESNASSQNKDPSKRKRKTRKVFKTKSLISSSSSNMEVQGLEIHADETEAKDFASPAIDSPNVDTNEETYNTQSGTGISPDVRQLIDLTTESVHQKLTDAMAEKPSVVATAVMSVSRSLMSTNSHLQTVARKLEGVTEHLSKKQPFQDIYKRLNDVTSRHIMGDVKAELKLLNQNTTLEHGVLVDLNKSVKELSQVIKTEHAKLRSTQEAVASSLSTFGAIMTRFTEQQEKRPTINAINDQHQTANFRAEWERARQDRNEKPYSYGGHCRGLHRRDHQDNRRQPEK